MTDAEASAFAVEWIDAWNSHDLDRILTHYSDDIEVTSPLVARVLGDQQVTIHGKVALRDYWGRALQQFPELRFTLFDVIPGVDSLVLHYQSVRELVGAEFMRFDGAGRVRQVVAHYTQP